jgi:chemotaxis protein methyltransferase CheR
VNSRPSEKEFELTDVEFKRLRDLVHERTGIALSDGKREMLYGRLARRLRKLNLTSFGNYCDLVEQGANGELQELTNAITTNLTSFFREYHHFETLAGEVLPQVEAARSATQRIRLWSAGCSTGEEPYSLAIFMREMLAHLPELDIKLLATDIDSKVVATAGRGPSGIQRGIPRTQIADHLQTVESARSVADERPVRRHLLPQCGDLFR